MKHNKIHMKHKRHICYTHNHMNLMNQSCCLSLILCKNIQCRNKVYFPQSPRSYKPTNQLALQMVCIQYIECAMKRQNDQGSPNEGGEPTISYRCSTTNMKNGLGNPLPSFSFLCHLSTFQPNQNFAIWSSFALSKIKSPKTD